MGFRSIAWMLGLGVFGMHPFPSSAQSTLWQPTAFPAQYGGAVFSFHVTSKGTVFAGTWLDGLVRSTDNGETWQSVGPYGSIISSDTSGTVYANAGDGGGFYRSTDDGSTWSLIGPSGAFATIRGIAVDAHGDLFAADFDAGIVRSTDRGTSWSPIAGSLLTTATSGPLVCATINGTGYLFAQVQDYNTSLSTLYRTSDEGESWSAAFVSSSYPLRNVFIHSSGAVFLSGPDGVMRSTDAGTSWDNVSRYTYNFQDMFSCSNGDIWAGYNYGFPQWGTVFYRSTDNGSTWSGYDTLGTGSVYAFAGCKDGSILLGTEKTGIFKTHDEGKTWKPVNSGMPNVQTGVSSISGLPGGFMCAGTTQFGSYVSTDFGATWNRNFPGHATNVTRIIVHPAGRIFAASKDYYYPYFEYSDDGGNHWQGTEQGFLAMDLARDAQQGVYLCGGGTGVQKSTDGGISWNDLHCPGSSYPRMHVANDGTIIVLAPYFNGYTTTWYYTRISTDGGATWSVTAPRDAQNPVNEYGSTGDGSLFAATSAGVYRSTDHGTSWLQTSLTLGDVSSLAANSANALFAGSASKGVFRSRDHGETWEPYSAGLPDSSITSLFVDDRGYLYAGTRKSGIFVTVGSTTSVGTGTDRESCEFRLDQNYPNPFNPATHIRYQIHDAGYLKLAVYDLLGREVAVLVNEIKQPGSYEVTWNASGFASGMYFCRMQAGGYSQTTKLILSR
jgi:photosystem II stability/assembly factor-like uncharacterized protein